MATPFGIRAWRVATGIASPLAPLWIRHRASRGKEDAARLGERMGMTQVTRPPGRLVWVHGASVGESLSALPLIEKLLQRGCKVLVTSGTVSSAAIMQARLPQGAIHQYVPLDTPRATARFISYWKPELGLFVESDLWPNLILAAAQRGVKLALVNARISERSASGWTRARATAAALLGAFNIVLAQDEKVAARFHSLGARDVRMVEPGEDAPLLHEAAHDFVAVHAALEQLERDLLHEIALGALGQIDLAHAAAAEQAHQAETSYRHRRGRVGNFRGVGLGQRLDDGRRQRLHAAVQHTAVGRVGIEQGAQLARQRRIFALQCVQSCGAFLRIQLGQFVEQIGYAAPARQLGFVHARAPDVTSGRRPQQPAPQAWVDSGATARGGISRNPPAAPRRPVAGAGRRAPCASRA